MSIEQLRSESDIYRTIEKARFASLPSLYPLYAMPGYETFQVTAAFAAGAHLAIGQTRKQSTELYINHPARVARILVDHGITDTVTIQAALLHDVLEDTKVIYDDLVYFFGKDVADLVNEVTDVSKPSDGNRAARKKLDCDHLSRASADGKNIKLADIIDNARDIRTDMPDFAPTWLAEKKDVLRVLAEGNPDLYMAASVIVYDPVVIGDP